MSSELEKRVCELQLQLREARAEADAAGALEAKLQLANRNARALEEENVLLHKQLSVQLGAAGVNGDGLHTAAARDAARVIIRENDALRDELDAARRDGAALARDAQVARLEYERSLRELREQAAAATAACAAQAQECATRTQERDEARACVAELQASLAHERDVAQSARALWDDERAHLQQRNDELRAALLGDGGALSAAQLHGLRVNYVGGPETVKERLLRDELSALEQRLRDAEAAHARAAAAWQAREAELCRARDEAAAAHDEHGDDTSQSDSNEDDTPRDARGLRKALRATRAQLADARTQVQQQRQQPVQAQAVQLSSTSPRHDAVDDDEACSLREQCEHERTRVLALQDSVDAADVHVRELTLQLHTAHARVAVVERERDAATAALQSAQHDATTLRGEVDTLRRSADERDAQAAARVQAAHDTAREARDEAARLRTATAMLQRALAEQQQQRVDEDVAAVAVPQPASTVVVTVPLSGEGVRQLVGDKTASVDEVMQQLEAAWQECDALRAQLRCAVAAYDTLHEAHRSDSAADAQRRSDEDARDVEVATLRRALGEVEVQLRDGEVRAREAERRLRDDLAAAQHALHKAEQARNAAEDDCVALRRRANAADDQRAALAHDISALQQRLHDATRAAAAASAHKRSPRASASRRRVRSAQRSTAQSAASLLNDAVTTPLASATLRRAQAPASPSIVSTTAIAAAAPPPPPVQPELAATAPLRRTLSQLSLESSSEQRRSVVPSGAHLAVTIVELYDVMRNGQAITEPGYIVIKVKSIKEKYKTSVKAYAPVTRFDETFIFYLAQPDQDVITLHVFYKTRSSAREYHIGDVCFSMATLYRGVPRRRVVPVMQSPGTRDARRAAQIEVVLQSDDFGRTLLPGVGDVEEEQARFAQLLAKMQVAAPEKLHAADVYMASAALM